MPTSQKANTGTEGAHTILQPSIAEKPTSRAAGGPPIKILCVHGVGHQEGDPQFEHDWQLAIASGTMRWNMTRSMQIEFVKYDDLFAAAPLTAFDMARAVGKLAISGLVHSIGDLFRPRRGFGDIRESLRWTAGMVVQWAENEQLRKNSRRRIEAFFGAGKYNPDVVLAHSLGSLLAYDTFARKENQNLLDGKILVTFGSQIGNPFVRSTLGGRIRPLAKARHWYHLFNKFDDAFTAELEVPGDNFEQVTATFDVSGILDHDAGEYLRHPNTTDVVWRAIAVPDTTARGMSRTAPASEVVIAKQAVKSRPAKVEKPQKRALLVGINDYPNPGDRLQGCVNDVFLMSSLLQECGFDAENIRVVLNERATAAEIVSRLEWLLEGSEDEQDRVFYYSGHGAQIPGYGIGETVDRKDECLVAYDFDWSREHAVTDDQFFELYSQLPYTTRFLTILDCCHSGGMTREGGARVRGLTPPDDIRHRELKWNKKEQMWVARDFAEVRPIVAERRKKPKFFGTDGASNRLGRASNLRAKDTTFDKATKDFDHLGPFMPIIIQACEENQYSYEYRHGVQSYGAFTYSMGLILREQMRSGKTPKWDDFIESVGKKLSTLQYDQNPCLVCPTSYKTKPIPWNCG
jgi:hypothetical protein